ncbi:MAG: hypothetical protein A2521_02685 [Deltaproteobacteria bacterium RIFOXYD12_FULL_57_12]|nr:MAG: hypothetical protein A2521_02685 [Deltaproteobacteria bacterium RIFOXYD12_FULL_57_12]
MYEAYYGFREKPFQIVPNPRFLFLSEKHRNALTYLEYGIAENVGFVLLTGEVGTGKTTLVRYLLNKIEQTMEVGVVFNTNVDPDELLASVLQAFGLEPVAGRGRTVEVLFRYLIENYARRRRVLLVIDEAQNLSRAALEEVRMLSNLQTDDHVLLQVMLVGQPELRQQLRAPELVQFSQRIAVQYHLGTLVPDETVNYIGHRLEMVGGTADLFAPAAMARIHDAAGGVPRLINILCDTALVYGYADGLHRIDVDVVQQVLDDRGETENTTAFQLPVADEGGEDKQALGERLATMEQAVRHLQAQWQASEMNRAGERASERMVGALTQQLREERERNDKLRRHLVELQAKYQHVEKAALVLRVQEESSKAAVAEEKKGFFSRLFRPA